MGNVASSEPERSTSAGSETTTPPVFAFGGSANGAHGAQGAQGGTADGSSGHLGDAGAGVTPPGKAPRVGRGRIAAASPMPLSHSWLSPSPSTAQSPPPPALPSPMPLEAPPPAPLVLPTPLPGSLVVRSRLALAGSPSVPPPQRKPGRSMNDTTTTETLSVEPCLSA